MTLRRDSDVVAAHGSVTRTPAPLSSSQLASLYSAEQGPDFSNYTAGTQCGGQLLIALMTLK